MSAHVISLHPWLEFGFICVATLALCWVGAELMERSPAAKFAFNGAVQPKLTAPASGPAERPAQQEGL